MSSGALPGLVYACMTHVPLWLEFPAFVRPLYLGSAQGEGKLNLRDLAPDWERHHPVLGGSVGTFALRRHVLAQHPDAKRVGICQYRKFISRERISGVAERTYPVMDIVQRSLLKGPEGAERLYPGSENFLVSRVMHFGKGFSQIDMFEQYKRAHHVDDLLRFAAAAVDLGVIDKDEVRGFFHSRDFIPGGVELGVFEAGFWLRSVGAIESVVKACVEQYPAHRSDYQVRAWSFCAERLGSYLLLRHFREVDGGSAWASRFALTRALAPSHRYIGQMNLITEDQSGRYVVGAPSAPAS